MFLPVSEEVAGHEDDHNPYDWREESEGMDSDLMKEIKSGGGAFVDKATFKEAKVYGTDGVPDMEQLVADVTEVLAGCNVESLGTTAWRYKG